MRKMRGGANLWTGSHFGLTWNESVPMQFNSLVFSNHIQLQIFLLYMHSLNGNFFWNSKCMIDEGFFFCYVHDSDTLMEKI
jgi:hypothetical protein